MLCLGYKQSVEWISVSVIITFIIYIMSITEIDNEYIKKCLNMISPEGGQITMTTAMKLRQEGIEQGIEQGGLLNKQEVLIRQPEKKFGLSEEGRKLIKTVTDFRKLDDALDIILFAENSEEVLNCLRS